MRQDKNDAIRLRKQSKSYGLISKELSIPKSTLHEWFKSCEWSNKIKNDLTIKANKIAAKKIKAMAMANKMKWELWRKEHRDEAKMEFSQLKNDPLVYFWYNALLG